MSKQMHVLDANVFIHGASRQLPEEFTNPVTVPEVTEELRSRDAGRRFDVGQVSVFAPDEQYVEQVSVAVEELGEDLSETDIRVVALAMEKDAVVVSDDYGVQNVAAYLDVRYRGFLKDEITAEIRWQYRCENCDRTVEDAEEQCPACGGEMERTPEEKQER